MLIAPLDGGYKLRDRRSDRRIGCRAIEFPSTTEIDAVNHACYDHLAGEYDQPTHETCRDFDIANGSLIRGVRTQVQAWRVDRGALSYLEIGVGPGSLFPLLKREFDLQHDRISVLDSSAKMLDVCSARNNGLIHEYHQSSIFSFNSAADQYDLVVALLCDPYLTPELFSALRKIVKPNGMVFLTLPSAEWASSVGRNELNIAIFHDAGGHSVRSFSFCWPGKYLSEKASQSGFRMLDWREVSIGTLSSLSSTNRRARLACGPFGGLVSGALLQRG